MSFQSCQRILFLLVLSSVVLYESPRALADIVSDGTLKIIDITGEELNFSLKIYAKTGKVKIEVLDDSSATIVRSDMQVILNSYPNEGFCTEDAFDRLYTSPYGLPVAVVPPGFVEPTIEFVDTGEVSFINSLRCRKYIISELSPVRLLQFTIYATEELDFPETIASFFSSSTPLAYKPLEEMKKIPGLPLKAVVTATDDNLVFTSEYVLFNYSATTVPDSVFDLPEGCTMR